MGGRTIATFYADDHKRLDRSSIAFAFESVCEAGETIPFGKLMRMRRER